MTVRCVLIHQIDGTHGTDQMSDPFTSVTAGRAMSSPPFVVGATATIAEAAEIMGRRNIGSARLGLVERY
jgi:CBS domain-containing protein